MFYETTDFWMMTTTPVKMMRHHQINLKGGGEIIKENDESLIAA